MSDDCDGIKNIYDELKSNKDSDVYVDKIKLAGSFEFKKQFMSGKGGASVYWVKDKDNNNIDRVLKIFPVESFEKDFEKNNELREIYFSCKLGKLRFIKQQGVMTLPDQDKNLFPGFFGFGYTNSDKTFDTKEKLVPHKKHFFMLMEFINGKDLFTFSEDKKNSPFKDKEKSKLILYQVVDALDEAHKKFGFFHMDLHPGNIMLSDNKNIDFVKIDERGLTIKTTVPMVKIIDFGLSTGSDFYLADGINKDDAKSLSLKPSRNYSLVLVNFARNIRSNPLAAPLFLKKGVEIAQEYPHGDDLQFINMMIYVFRNEFKDGFVDYCNSYQDCKDKLLKP